MRRLKGFYVSGESVAQLCRNTKTSMLMRVEGPLPETAMFYSTYFDRKHNSFVCIFEDDSFDIVPECAAIPIVGSPTITILRSEKDLGL